MNIILSSILIVDLLALRNTALHPSLRVHYMETVKWEQDRIDTSVELADACWKAYHKPELMEPIPLRDLKVTHPCFY